MPRDLSAVAMAMCLLSVIGTVLCHPSGHGDTENRQQGDSRSDIHYSSQRLPGPCACIWVYAIGNVEMWKYEYFILFDLILSK